MWFTKYKQVYSSYKSGPRRCLCYMVESSIQKTIQLRNQKWCIYLFSTITSLEIKYQKIMPMICDWIKTGLPQGSILNPMLALASISDQLDQLLFDFKACVHYVLTNFYFSSKDSPSKAMKMFFISSRKLFLLWRYSLSLLFLPVSHCFSLIQDKY